ncbi:hypothetical protein, partial [Pseudomonas viridiflava]|uniref:hypothetical protein n=1 Tax=Pseudomonas viridiflava TaxID=33069 RepID=UPI00197FC695
DYSTSGGRENTFTIIDPPEIERITTCRTDRSFHHLTVGQRFALSIKIKIKIKSGSAHLEFSYYDYFFVCTL